MALLLFAALTLVPAGLALALWIHMIVYHRVSRYTFPLLIVYMATAAGVFYWAMETFMVIRIQIYPHTRSTGLDILSFMAVNLLVLGIQALIWYRIRSVSRKQAPAPKSDNFLDSI